MYGEHHDLAHDFPEYREKIHELKQADKHFANLFDEYHKVDREVRRIEQGIETPSDEYVETLKKKRLQLKDQLFARLKAD
jgi:uncharacterized protein YdcH (DUF465 family)